LGLAVPGEPFPLELLGPVFGGWLVQALVFVVVGEGLQQTGCAPLFHCVWMNPELICHLLKVEESFLAESLISGLETITPPDSGDQPAVEGDSFSGAKSPVVEDAGDLTFSTLVQEPVDFPDDGVVGLAQFPGQARPRELQRPAGSTLEAHVGGDLVASVQSSVLDDEPGHALFLTDGCEGVLPEPGEAEAEWARIEASLAKFVGGELVVGALALGPAIAVGGAEWAAAGVVASGITHLIAGRLQKKAYLKTNPAAFLHETDSRKRIFLSRECWGAKLKSIRSCSVSFVDIALLRKGPQTRFSTFTIRKDRDRLNLKQLKGQIGNEFHLRPIPLRINSAGDTLPQSDDRWRLEEFLEKPSRLRLVNVHTGHVVELQPDNVKEYRSPGFLMLRCQLQIRGPEIRLEPVAGTSLTEGEVFIRLETQMPGLLAEMRRDLVERPLAREFVILRRAWSYWGKGNELVYYFDDHPHLHDMLHILSNLGLVQEITYNNTERYIISERLAAYLSG